MVRAYECEECNCKAFIVFLVNDKEVIFECFDCGNRWGWPPELED